MQKISKKGYQYNPILGQLLYTRSSVLLYEIISMDFIRTPIERTCQENEIYENVLSLDNKHCLELGCGKAYITRLIVTAGTGRSMVAMEVDKIQHKKNLQISDLPNVVFKLAGGEDITEDNETFDYVFMFKSLHHVPLGRMDDTLKEIHRVLKPSGIAYISEPVFDGDFNEVIRLFHDEEIVRKAAFKAVKNSIDKGLFNLQEQIFFNAPRHYNNFGDFENRLIKVTHTNHSLPEQLLEQVQKQFNKHMTKSGADFLTPVRVDILKKL